MEKRSRNDNIPEVFSWAMCGEVRWPWLAGMMAAAVLFGKLEAADFCLGLLFAAVLLLAAALDYRYLLIYDRLVIWLLVLGTIPLLGGRLLAEDALTGAALGSGFLGVLRWLVPRGMGWGDVKLAFVLGWWLGPWGMAICLYLAFMAGGMYGLWVLFRQRLALYQAVPFGPFLAGGALVAFALRAYSWEMVVEWLCWQ